MIRANCRDRFTAEDFHFIVKTLGQSRSAAVSLTELLTDADSRDAILDHELLVQAILSHDAHLSISPQFYFYILTRHVLKDAGLQDRRVSDYLASLLETFSQTARMKSPVDTAGNPLQYLSDMLLALRDASPTQTFLIRAHVGNYSLFLSGIFHENVTRRCERGAPDISYYENLGRMNYQVVASHAVARSADLSDIYAALSERFHEVRLALNRLSESLIHIDDVHLAFARMRQMTLFSEIQNLFERTYARVGINLEDCLIDRHRCGQLSRLAGASARELSDLARTFLRRSGDQLYVGIYYSRWLIEQLEKNDPRGGLTDENIRSLIVFVEEINHALHAALIFKNGCREIQGEDFARNLELQAMVDTYLVLLLFVAFFRKTQRISRADRRWLRFHMFSMITPNAYADANLRGRYLETTELAASYTQYLDALNAARRVDEIRIFHALAYEEKKHRILALQNSPKTP